MNRRDTPTYVIDLPPETIELVKAERWGPDYEPGWWNRPDVRNLPEVGERWSYGDWQQADRKTATHALIRCAAFSDYSGSDVEASNYRSLLRDFPDTFVEAFGGFGTQALMLPVSCLNEAVLEAIVALADYPLYDDEDSSELVMDWTNTAITDYLKPDMVNDLERADRQAEADAVAATGDEEFREHVWRFYSDASEYPYAEAVETIVFPQSDELTEYVVTAVLDRWAADITAPADNQTVLTKEDAS